MTLAPTPFLDNKHTIFGRVSSGMRVLQRLGAVGVDAQDRSVYSLPFISSCLSLGRCLRWAEPHPDQNIGHEKKSRSTKLEQLEILIDVFSIILAGHLCSLFFYPLFQPTLRQKRALLHPWTWSRQDIHVAVTFPEPCNYYML